MTIFYQEKPNKEKYVGSFVGVNHAGRNAGEIEVRDIRIDSDIVEEDFFAKHAEQRTQNRGKINLKHLSEEEREKVKDAIEFL